MYNSSHRHVIIIIIIIIIYSVAGTSWFVTNSSLWNKQIDPAVRSRLLAVSAQHSGEWLNTLPNADCRLHLDNEVICVSVCLRLGCRLCEPHSCPCGATVDARGLHGLSCRRSAGRTSRHNYLNDVIWRALNKAGVPSIKEPPGLLRSDGKRPDGLTQIPFESGKCVAWDVTVTDTLAASNLNLSSAAAGGAAEYAALRKVEKYTDLSDCYSFVPIAFETLGPVCLDGSDFINKIGSRLRAVSGDARETTFLWQRLSVAVQRFNAVCLLGTFEAAQDI